ncbi:hypothetical protein K438DRAFT_2056484 [Mycena galopus ATCC 62051]|nr:hypothetical protein K438DRAFT_2056484 [Mycena galopus ATCC 62051]
MNLKCPEDWMARLRDPRKLKGWGAVARFSQHSSSPQSPHSHSIHGVREAAGKIGRVRKVGVPEWRFELLDSSLVKGKVSELREERASNALEAVTLMRKKNVTKKVDEDQPVDRGSGERESKSTPSSISFSLSSPHRLFSVQQSSSHARDLGAAGGLGEFGELVGLGFGGGLCFGRLEAGVDLLGKSRIDWKGMGTRLRRRGQRQGGGPCSSRSGPGLRRSTSLGVQVVDGAWATTAWTASVGDDCGRRKRWHWRWAGRRATGVGEKRRRGHGRGRERHVGG